MLVFCCNCKIEFDKSISEIARSKTGNHFCTKSCSACYNNKRPEIRRQLEGKCRVCDIPISSTRTFCTVCFHRRTEIDYFTKIELKKQSNYHQRLRVDSRRKKIEFTPHLSCVICGYTTFVEVAHIKAVASFPDDTLIKTINDVENLVYLCPNHHREYDSGLISLDSVET